MAAVIIEDVSGARPDTDNVTGVLSPRIFKYQGLAVGEDILLHPDIPAPLSTIVVSGLTYFLARRRVEAFTDANGMVECVYTTQDPGVFNDSAVKPWSMTYKKVDYPYPIFGRRTDFITVDGITGGVYVWDRQDITIPVNYPVLRITVARIQSGTFSNAQTRDDIFSATRQAGRFHIFSFWPNDIWLMQPPEFRQVSASRVEIDYMWLLDPGNGQAKVPIDPDTQEPLTDEYILGPPRPPWNYYTIRPATEIDSTPQIVLGPLTGVGDTHWDPTGYLTLPGNPLT